jgi:hypothetical protein
MTPARPNAQPHTMPILFALGGDGASEAAWPTALRALLLLSEAVHPADPLLARLSDDDLALLRASMARLAGAEPTSAA